MASVTVGVSNVLLAVAVSEAETEAALTAFEVTVMVPVRVGGVSLAAVICTSMMQEDPGATGVAPVTSPPALRAHIGLRSLSTA